MNTSRQLQDFKVALDSPDANRVDVQRAPGFGKRSNYIVFADSGPLAIAEVSKTTADLVLDWQRKRAAYPCKECGQ